MKSKAINEINSWFAKNGRWLLSVLLLLSVILLTGGKKDKLSLSSPKQQITVGEPLILHVDINTSKQKIDKSKLVIDINHKDKSRSLSSPFSRTLSITFGKVLSSKNKRFIELIVFGFVNQIDNKKSSLDIPGEYQIRVRTKNERISSNFIGFSVKKRSESERNANKLFVNTMDIMDLFQYSSFGMKALKISDQKISDLRTLISDHPKSPYVPYAAYFLLKYDFDKFWGTNKCKFLRRIPNYKEYFKELPQPSTLHLDAIENFANARVSAYNECKKKLSNKNEILLMMKEIVPLYKSKKWGRKKHEMWIDEVKNWLEEQK